MLLKLKETNISNEHNRLKNPNWREADQLPTYKHDRGVELGSTKKLQKLQLSSESETTGTRELRISGFQVRRPNHSATLPPLIAILKSGTQVSDFISHRLWHVWR